MVTKYALLKQSSSYYNKIQKIKNVLAKCPQHRKHPLLATSQWSTIFGTFSKSVVMAGAEGDNVAGHLSAIFGTFSKSVVIAGVEGDDAGDVVTASDLSAIFGTFAKSIVIAGARRVMMLVL